MKLSDTTENPGCSSQNKSKLLSEIKVIEVNKDNLCSIWPYLLVSLKTADYVAVDLELSGLGSLSLFKSKNVEDRYAAIRETATTRSNLSLGIAIFKLSKHSEKKRKMVYKCQVFNILTMCSDPFTIEPEALQFLSRHSFDFNRLIKTGVIHERKAQSPLCSLFNEIFTSNVPLLLHNGLVDIAFIYHHFYSPLPKSFGQFCNALSDLFPPSAPLIDSKYLAEFKSTWGTSFLEYVFRKSQRDNVRESDLGRWHIGVKFDSDIYERDVVSRAVETVPCSLPVNFPAHAVPRDLKDNLCPQFSNHGFCRKSAKSECSRVHNVDFALDLEDEKHKKERRKRKRRYEHLKPVTLLDQERSDDSSNSAQADSPSISIEEMDGKSLTTGCHRAGVDAFMTGFSVLFQLRRELSRREQIDVQSVNILPLSGKQQGMAIQRTQFATDCPLHLEAFKDIESKRKPAL